MKNVAALFILNGRSVLISGGAVRRGISGPVLGPSHCPGQGQQAPSQQGCGLSQRQGGNQGALPHTEWLHTGLHHMSSEATWVGNSLTTCQSSRGCIGFINVGSCVLAQRCMTSKPHMQAQVGELVVCGSA